MKKSIWTKTLLIAIGLPLMAGCIVERHPRRVVVVEHPEAGGEVIVERPAAPPPVRVEVRPVAPGPGYIWVAGCWEWRHDWVWVPGRWVVRPRPHAVWVVGRWEHRPHGYVWVGGHWR